MVGSMVLNSKEYGRIILLVNEDGQTAAVEPAPRDPSRILDLSIVASEALVRASEIRNSPVPNDHEIKFLEDFALLTTAPVPEKKEDKGEGKAKESNVVELSGGERKREPAEEEQTKETPKEELRHNAPQSRAGR